MRKQKYPHIFIDGEELKWCPYHRQYHLLQEFNKNSNAKDGLQAYCLKASVEKNLAWREKNRSHVRCYQRKYQVTYYANKKSV